MSQPPPPPASPPYPAAAQPPVQPPAGWTPPYVPRTNGFAVASLVLGILFCLVISAVLAVIFGNIALGQIARSEGRERGRGLAIAGIVLGWVGIGFLGLGALIWLGYGISNL